MNIRATFDDSTTPKHATKPTLPADAPSSAARNLALAYKIEDLIERGLIADFTAAARVLQVSQPRVTHLMALRLLCPEIQQAILLGELEFADKELRQLARIADWSTQRAAVAARSATPTPRRSRRSLAPRGS